MSNLTFVLAGAAVLIAIVVIYGLAQRRRGRAEADRDRAEDTAKQAQEGHEIDEDVRRLSDDDLYDELRRK